MSIGSRWGEFGIEVQPDVPLPNAPEEVAIEIQVFGNGFWPPGTVVVDYKRQVRWSFHAIVVNWALVLWAQQTNADRGAHLDAVSQWVHHTRILAREVPKFIAPELLAVANRAERALVRRWDFEHFTRVYPDPKRQHDLAISGTLWSFARLCRSACPRWPFPHFVHELERIPPEFFHAFGEPIDYSEYSLDPDAVKRRIDRLDGRIRSGHQDALLAGYLRRVLNAESMFGPDGCFNEAFLRNITANLKKHTSEF